MLWSLITCYVYLTILKFSQSLLNIPTESFLNPYFKEYIQKYQSAKNLSFCSYVNVKNTRDVSDFFIRHNACPAVTAGKFFNASGYVAKMHATFIFIDDFNKINETIDWMHNFSFWNPRRENHFIIAERLRNLDFLHEFMSIIWKRHIVNFVVVLVFHKLEIFSYNGFKNDQIINMTESVSLFQDKLSNLYGYTLRISFFEFFPLSKKENGKWVGPDTIRLKLITSMMNASFKIIEPPENTFFHGAYKDAMTDVTDFCFISHYYMNNLFQDAEYTYPHEPNQISVVIPIREKSFNFYTLLYTFQLAVWILFLATIVTISFVTNLARVRRNQTFLIILLRCVTSFLGNAFIGFDNQKFIIKIQLIIFFFGCIIFRTAFQCSLVGSFMGSKSYDEIETISQLRNTKLKMFTSKPLADVIPEDYGLCDKIFVISTPERIKKCTV